MTNANTLPPDLAHQPEALPLPNPATAEQLGGIALRDEAVTDAYIEEGLERLNAEANGADIRAEDIGRIHDVEAAHEAALVQNEVFDIYDQAELENEIFKAHTEALAEEESRNQLRIEEQKAAEAKKAEEAPQVSETDYRKQAEVALEDAGYRGRIPAGSQVHKDVATGNLVITSNHNHDVKIIEQNAGGRARITDYKLNSEGVLTISAQGANTITARVGDYVESAAKDVLDRPEPKTIALPPAVARAVGFKRATPITQQTSQAA